MVFFELLFVAVVAVVFLFIAFKFMKKLITNTIFGLLVLGLMYFMGVSFSIPWYITITITIICGLPGIATLFILHIAGLI